MNQCCPPTNSKRQKIDIFLWGWVIVIVGSYSIYSLTPYPDLNQPVWAFMYAIYDLVNTMWWGVLFGIMLVGFLSKIPREFVMKILGNGGGLKGIIRATIAGILLDLCNHGILLVGMKLYERGATIGQTMAFLIASPWNSLTLTIILIALIGIKWTMLFILLSFVIAVISGLIFELLVKRGVLPANPNKTDLPHDFKILKETKKRLNKTHFTPKYLKEMAILGTKESKLVLRWLFFGVVLAAIIRAVVDADQFAVFFGATLAGLGATILAATIIEVCSEGSTPIAADLLTRAEAPGNSFAFLMTGVSTDYTEIMSIKETTRSWKISLFLPLVTVPQVVAISWIINSVS